MRLPIWPAQARLIVSVTEPAMGYGYAMLFTGLLGVVMGADQGNEGGGKPHYCLRTVNGGIG